MSCTGELPFHISQDFHDRSSPETGFPLRVFVFLERYPMGCRITWPQHVVHSPQHASANEDPGMAVQVANKNEDKHPENGKWKVR